MSKRKQRKFLGYFFLGTGTVTLLEILSILLILAAMYYG